MMQYTSLSMLQNSNMATRNVVTCAVEGQIFVQLCRPCAKQNSTSATVTCAQDSGNIWESVTAICESRFRISFSVKGRDLVLHSEAEALF
jgi:hypothetical protein